MDAVSFLFISCHYIFMFPAHIMYAYYFLPFPFFLFVLIFDFQFGSVPQFMASSAADLYLRIKQRIKAD